MTTRRSVLGAGLALSGATLAGCGVGSVTPPGTVSIYTDNPGWNASLQAAGAVLRRRAGVGLTPQELPTTTSFQQVIKASLRTRKTPDLIKWWSGYRLEDLARTGGATDLTDIWSAAEKNGWVLPSLRPAFTSAGRIYGLPMNLAFWVVFYNPKLFARHGVGVPKTWAELEAAAALFAGRGITPFFGTTAGRWPAFIWFQEILSKLDPDFYERLMNGQARYTDPTVVQAMRLWKSMLDRKWFTPLDTSDSDATSMLKREKLAMLPFGTFINTNFTKNGMKPGVDVQAFVLPPVSPRTPRSVIFEASALMLPRKAPRQAAALNLMRQWLAPETQTAFTHGLQDGSPNPLVKPANPLVAGLFEQTRNVRLLNRFWESSPPALVESAVDDLGSFLLDPPSYPQVLRNLQDKADAEWAVWRNDS